MKKCYVILTLLLCLAFCLLPTAAEPTLPRLVDDAGLLNSDEAADLLAQLDEISARQACDVVIVTVDSLGGKNVTAYADDTFDNNGFGQGSDYSGILFLISMAEREWAISTCGTAIAVFTDARQDSLIDAIIDDLSAGRYYAAFSAFAGHCDSYLTQGVPTHTPDYSYPYDDGYNNFYEDQSNIDYGTESTFSLSSCIGVALVIGLIAAVIYTSVLKGQLKSVASATHAANYTRKGSFKLTDRSEVFLYRNVTRRARQQNNGHSGGHSGARSGSSHSSTHRSSSGRSHGGSRGRF